MIYELLLSFFLMEPVADDDKKKERVAIQQKQQQITWPIGCWNCRSWGAIRLLEDSYAIDLDPEGKLNNWGVWQYSGSEDRVLIVWIESGMMEIIEKRGDKYLRQSAYSWGIASEIEEVKKIGE